MLLALFLLPRGASALTISPAYVDHTLNPGDTVIETLKVINDQGGQITVYPRAENFTAGADEGGTPQFYAAEEDPYGTALAKWITFDSQPIVLQPNERANLVFTINVPTDVQPGGHYGAVILGRAAPETQGGHIGLESEIGELVMVRVSGDIKEQASLAEFGFKQPQVWYNHLPVDFFFRFENSGNTHLRPVGNLFVKNWLGQQVAAVVINEDLKGVLPHSIRRFDFAWGGASSGGLKEKPGFTEGLIQEWENFGFGKYKATLVLNYGASNKIIVDQREFTVWPWRLLCAGGVVLLLILLFFALLMKLNNMAVIRRYEKMKKTEQTEKKQGGSL